MKWRTHEGPGFLQFLWQWPDIMPMDENLRDDGIIPSTNMDAWTSEMTLGQRLQTRHLYFKYSIFKSKRKYRSIITVDKIPISLFMHSQN